MRINQFIAQATGTSRRAADALVAENRVQVNGQTATVGQTIRPADRVFLDNRAITPAVKTVTIMFNKPIGYVCSRNGQGSKTIYDLLPEQYRSLKPVGRLDKDSSGLLLLTNDGQLANRLTHPRYAKKKVYEVRLDKHLLATDKVRIEQGIKLEDGPSKLRLKPLDQSDTVWEVIMAEGRNRQIRRTFATLGYNVIKLHRTHFGEHALDDLDVSSMLQIK